MIVIWQIIEFLAAIVVTITFFVKISVLSRQGIKMKQEKLAQYGPAVGFLGMLIASVIPRIISAQYGTKDTGQLIEALVFLVGFSLIIIGFQFILASYKTEDENPHWIRWILDLWK